jgi:RNA-directed DNA polymerase
MAETKAPQGKRKPPLDPASESWNRLPWRKLEQQVYRIQKRIFKAEFRGNRRAVHKLQKLLMKSRAARLVAVRRVTQDNQGKKTAGVDGVKSVPPKQRFDLAERIHPKCWKRSATRPARRVWIPKPGKPGEQRPLGIPVMETRAQQALVKLALEPEWESKFGSYVLCVVPESAPYGRIKASKVPPLLPYREFFSCCYPPSFRCLPISPSLIFIWSKRD